MANQVVIEFVGDYSKVQSDLQSLGKSDVVQKQVEQFNEVNKAATAAAGSVSKIGSTSKEAGNQLDKMAAAAANVGKGIAGAAGKQAFDGLRSSVQGAVGDITKLGSSLDAAKAKLNSLTEGTPQFEKLSEEIKATELAMQRLAGVTASLNAGTATAREQSKSFSNTLIALRQAGLEDTEVYNSIKAALGQLNIAVADVNEEIGAVSTKTQGLKALTEAAEGAAGAFEATASASALFGEKSEEIEKTTQKLIAVMALANGIQKLYNVTEKENAAVLAIVRGQQALQAVSTRLAAAAESEYVVVRWAATAAQAALNAVMMANPVVLLIGALVAAGAALYAFASTSNKAEERQKALNEEMKLSIEYLEQYAKGLVEGFDERIKDLQAELTVMKAKNVSQQAILDKEKEILAVERDAAGHIKGFRAQEIHDLGELNALLEKEKQHLIDVQYELDHKQAGNFFTRWIYGERSADAVNQDMENTRGRIENIQKQIEIGEKAQDDYRQKAAEDDAKAEEIRKKQIEQGLKDNIAVAEARLSQTNATTKDELNAQIGLIQRKQALELNDANLSGKQRIAIEEQNARQIRDLQYNYSLQVAKGDLSIYQAYAQGKLQTISAGSAEELEIEKQLLIQKRDVDVLAARDNIREVQRIRLQFEADYTKLLKDYARQRNLDAIETEKLLNNARLQAVDAGTHQELDLRLQAVELERQSEIAAIDDRIRNTVKGQAQIADINAKALQQQEELQRQFLQREIDYEAQVSKEVNDIRISRLQAQANSPRTSDNRRFELQQEQRRIELQNIDVEIEANKRLYANKLETQEEYVQKSLELENERLQKQGEIDNADLDHQKKFYTELGNVALDITQQVSDAIFAVNDNRIRQEEENQKAALERDKSATLNSKFLTNQQKAVIDEAFRRQQVAAEREAAIKKRDNDTHQAEVDGFLAIAKVWAEHSDNPILAAILTALAIVKTTEQVSKIKSTPLPTYATGVEMLDGPGGPTSDSIVARLSRGERVVPADVNKRYFPALSAIHNQLIPPSIANDLLTAPLTPSIDLESMESQRWYHGDRIDYDKLGQAVAKHMAPHLEDIQQNTFSFDERGFTMAIQQGIQKQEFLNKRYSFRKK